MPNDAPHLPRHYRVRSQKKTPAQTAAGVLAVFFMTAGLVLWFWATHR